MELTRKNAMKLWEKQFGNVVIAEDFTGRKIQKGAYDQKTSQYGWIFSNILPKSKGGLDTEDNILCVHVRTANDKSENYPSFVSDDIRYSIVQKGNQYVIEKASDTEALAEQEEKLLAAYEKWELQFGKNTYEAVDFSGRTITKDKYLSKDENGWKIACYVEAKPNNVYIANIQTIEECYGKTAFRTNGSFYTLCKENGKYFFKLNVKLTEKERSLDNNLKYNSEDPQISFNIPEQETVNENKFEPIFEFYTDSNKTEVQAVAGEESDSDFTETTITSSQGKSLFEEPLIEFVPENDSKDDIEEAIEETPVVEDTHITEEVTEETTEVELVEEPTTVEDAQTHEEVPVVEDTQTLEEAPVVEDTQVTEEVTEESTISSEVEETTTVDDVPMVEETPIVEGTQVVEEPTEEITEVELAKESQVTEEVNTSSEIEEPTTVEDAQTLEEAKIIKESPVVETTEDVQITPNGPSNDEVIENAHTTENTSNDEKNIVEITSENNNINEASNESLTTDSNKQDQKSNEASFNPADINMVNNLIDNNLSNFANPYNTSLTLNFIIVKTISYPQVPAGYIGALNDTLFNLLTPICGTCIQDEVSDIVDEDGSHHTFYTYRFYGMQQESFTNSFNASMLLNTYAQFMCHKFGLIQFKVYDYADNFPIDSLYYSSPRLSTINPSYHDLLNNVYSKDEGFHKNETPTTLYISKNVMMNIPGFLESFQEPPKTYTEANLVEYNFVFPDISEEVNNFATILMNQETQNNTEENPQ